MHDNPLKTPTHTPAVRFLHGTGRRASRGALAALMLLFLAGDLWAAASDTLAGAQPITLPYYEIVDNSSFGENPSEDFCGEDPSGDFFYRFTPTVSANYWILAEGLDTEIYVYDLSQVGSEGLECQDDDNIFSYFSTQTYGWEVAENECDECSESLYVDLDAGTEYIISIASHDAGGQGLIRVNIGQPDPAATVQVPTAPQALASDSLAGAQTISLPYFEIVDNSTFTADVADDYCNESPEGDFFYRYSTGGAQETLLISAESVDTEIYVFDLADVGNEDFYCADDDNAASFYAAQISLADLVDYECFECSEAFDINLDPGTEYIIAIASNGEESLGPTRVNIRAISDYPVALPPTPSIPVPVLPLWALALLAALMSGVGLARLRSA